MTEQASRAHDLNKIPDPNVRRHHRSALSATFRYTPHGPDVPTPARDPSRQASLRLDFLIIGGGLLNVPDIIASH
jgi:hypothetical protein